MARSYSQLQALDHFRQNGAIKVDPLMIHAPRLPLYDCDVAYLSALAEIEHLVLTDTYITDECMPVIGQLRNLCLLDISNTPITDGGAHYIAALNKLETLGIYGTQITDSTIEIISKLPNLKSLNVSYTSVTDAGLLKLVRPLGYCIIEIHHSNITTSGIREFIRHCPLTVLNTDDGLVCGDFN